MSFNETPPDEVRLTQREIKNLVAGRTDEQIAQAIRALVSSGRPRAEINLEELAELARIGASIPEIAAHFGVSEKTIDRKLADPEIRTVWMRGDAKGKLEIRLEQHEAATKDHSPAMLIYLGTLRCGQPNPKFASRQVDAAEKVEYGWVEPKQPEQLPAGETVIEATAVSDDEPIDMGSIGRIQ